jgi:hypothetical protein
MGGLLSAQGVRASASILFQDEPECMDNAADAEQENPQSEVDPEIFCDLTFMKVDGQRGNEKCDDNFKNLVIHSMLLFIITRKGSPLQDLLYAICPFFSQQIPEWMFPIRSL